MFHHLWERIRMVIVIVLMVRVLAVALRRRRQKPLRSLRISWTKAEGTRGG